MEDAMVRRDVDALVKWAAGSGAITFVPHAITLPPTLATSLAWVGGTGILITGVVGIVVALTKLTTEPGSTDPRMRWLVS
jgi:hypothetical protein